MSVLTIVEASKQFNVTRPRIYRSIKKGELTTTLSDEGVQLVQVQDMIRLFSNVKPKVVQKDVRNTVTDTDLKLVQLLEEQLRKAEEDKAFLKQQITDLRNDYEEYKLKIEHKNYSNQKTDVTAKDHVQINETLQIEHAINDEKEQNNLQQEKSNAENKPNKKGLLRRLVGEFLR